jgi:hypothetical protein
MRDRKFDVKGESIDEERNEEGCKSSSEEKGCPEEKGQVTSSAPKRAAAKLEFK